MKKIISIASLIAICNIYDTALSAQDQSSILTQKFEDQITNLHQEKIFIHTDRSIYITSETLWMSAYCVDAALHYPTDLSKVLNIELIDSNGQSIKQERIQLDNGAGQGQMFISPEISSGFYTLRAYTNWMRNFDSDFSFQKTITVINPSSSKSTDSLAQSNTDPIITFHPEGGSLLYGTTSKVAVKASDEFGDGLSLTGVVFDNEDNEVAKFSTTGNGYSSFLISPQKGKTYAARIAIDSLIKKYELPHIKDRGIGLSVSQVTGSRFDILLTSNINFQQLIYVVVHTRGIINQIEELDLKAIKSLHLLSKNLQPGISHITVMDEEFNPIADRIVFLYPDPKQPITLELDKSIYEKREKVSLAIKTGELESDDKLAQLSVSVSRSHNSSIEQGNIISNLLLTSDIKDSRDDHHIYFGSNNNVEMDLLMLTNSWKRFDWRDVLTNENTLVKYPAETHSPILAGHILKDDDKDFPRSLQMSFSGKASLLNSVKINPEGIFHFEVPYRIRNEKVYFSVQNDSLSLNQIVVDSPFDFPINSKYKANRFISELSQKYLEELYSNIQIAQVYREKFNHVNGLPTKNETVNTHFYGKPDHLYLLDDYTRFETVKDLFIEYIRTPIIKKKRGKSDFYIINKKSSGDKALMMKALGMIDGLPVFDTDFILNFDPLKIEKIEVVDDFYYVGNEEYTGIVNFTTYKGDFGEQELPKHLLEKAYKGLQLSRRYYSPDYSLHAPTLKRIPDYRNTLYWNPNATVSTDGNIYLEFDTSDEAGLFHIEINGITTKGIPIYMKTGFNVESN